LRHVLNLWIGLASTKNRGTLERKLRAVTASTVSPRNSRRSMPAADKLGLMRVGHFSPATPQVCIVVALAKEAEFP
jgi:hypothetical protein